MGPLTRPPSPTHHRPRLIVAVDVAGHLPAVGLDAAAVCADTRLASAGIDLCPACRSRRRRRRLLEIGTAAAAGGGRGYGATIDSDWTGGRRRTVGRLSGFRAVKLQTQLSGRQASGLSGVRVAERQRTGRQGVGPRCGVQLEGISRRQLWPEVNIERLTQPGSAGPVVSGGGG